jgi:purine-binding chemotaxis protein CheW
MHTHELLSFRLRQLQYGIPVSCVREIFPLPEINPAPEAPADIIGLLNWRGNVLPVMHLDRRLGQPLQPCQLTDSIIVIEAEGLQVGMIVNQVEDVVSLPEQWVEPDITYGRDNHINTAFLTGVAKVDAQLLLLLNPDALIRLADEVAMLIWQSDLSMSDQEQDVDTLLIPPINPVEPKDERVTADFYTLYCPQATLQERSIFANRAAELQQSLETKLQTQTSGMAILGLAGEYFGIQFLAVQLIFWVTSI